MKSLLALKDITSKLKQQAKDNLQKKEEAWVKQGDLEKEREQRYLEEQSLRDQEKQKKQELKLAEIQ